ncbi:methyltransferase domain-containing protein [Sphingobium phenoxybenzoativorans]|uniref:Methyltransferase domain-containing protein n=1 Tax=Sphingobium phenoxybenzoativorans TaxID=1592790 RepID=A0A975K3U8_9SPHN|nr:class I SAM-dependent methyltransferase [Sphingobium phenoxybenzoativorans]QUT04364.1 methyltransferase domain-containing protein [Sphingobium phenoxybenzoativorans]
MNLYDMFRRGDRNLVTTGDVALTIGRIAGNNWRGLRLPYNASIRIPDALRFHSLRSWPDTCGWFAQDLNKEECPKRPFFHPANWRSGAMASEVTQPHLTVSVRDHKTDKILNKIRIDCTENPVHLPWPRGAHDKIDIVIEMHGKESDAVFLANHRVLSRKSLFDAARGTGVEIGPGAQPQIMPGSGVSVSYVEQMPPAEWNRLYNSGGKYPVKPELWDNYIVGDASDIPVADSSLDFIFSSHVFEHLANPIGHLERWARKLAPGGQLLCVIPDLGGTKDSVQSRSDMHEWINEYERAIWEPSLSHYMRHLRQDADSPRVSAAMDRKESIHVHYYDNVNFQSLADFAVRNLGYASYSIEHTPNHKDFHIILVKS